MDPLSVAASIAGLLAASQKISLVVGGIVSKSLTAPKEIGELKFEVDTTRAVLQ